MTITTDATNLLSGSGCIRFTDIKETPEAVKKFVELITNPALKEKASFKSVKAELIASPFDIHDPGKPFMGHIIWYPV